MRYHCVIQHDIADCGAACIATICRQKGYNIGISNIREVAGTDKQGTSAYGIVKAIQKLGFEARAVKGNKEAFFSEFPLPCIAHVIVDGKILHYIVIHKITKKYIVIADPNEGIVKINPSEFFGEEGKKNIKPKYKWSGVLILVTDKSKLKSFEKDGAIYRLLCLLKPYKTLLLHIFMASLVYTALGILGAFYFKVLIDSVLIQGLRKTLMTLSVGVIILNIFKVILNGFRSHLLLYLSQRLDIVLLLGYYSHVVELPMKFFNTRNIGEIVSRFNDAEKIRDTISSVALIVMIDTIMTFAGAVILYKQSANLFIITFIMVAMYILIVVFFNGLYKKFNKNQMENNEQFTSHMIESLNGIQTVKVYCAESKIIRKAEEKFLKLLKSNFTLNWTNNLQESLKSLIELVGINIIIWVGAINVIEGKMTIGTLMSFNTLLGYFFEPLKNLISLQPKIQTAIVAIDRLNEILDLEVEKKAVEYKKIVPNSLGGDIEINNVSFRYGTRKPVLNNINVSIKKGQKVAFVGSSGSGKTTLSKLLLRLYSPENGKILINNINIDDIQVEKLREKIAYISQDTFLFGESIYDNLKLGQEDISLDEVIDISERCQAREFIDELPLRYETIIEENGSNLSSGQKQRLAIIRAMIRKPDILILDEATSNLDATTEKEISNTIKDICKNMTTIIIAHRLSTIKECDKIFVMDGGKIIESGNHYELCKLGGKYAELVENQRL